MSPLQTLCDQNTDSVRSGLWYYKQISHLHMVTSYTRHDRRCSVYITVTDCHLSFLNVTAIKGLYLVLAVTYQHMLTLKDCKIMNSKGEIEITRINLNMVLYLHNVAFPQRLNNDYSESNHHQCPQSLSWNSKCHRLHLVQCFVETWLTK